MNLKNGYTSLLSPILIDVVNVEDDCGQLSARESTESLREH